MKLPEFMPIPTPGTLVLLGEAIQMIGSSIVLAGLARGADSGLRIQESFDDLCKARDRINTALDAYLGIPNK